MDEEIGAEPCGATGVMQRCLILVVLNRGANRSHLCFRKKHRRQVERGGNRLGAGGAWAGAHVELHRRDP